MITLLVASHLPWHWISTSAAHRHQPLPSIRLAGLTACLSFPLSALAPAESPLSPSAPTLAPAEGAWQCPAPAVYSLYSLYTLYTCGEMSECDDTPSQLWGCHIFSQTTHVIPRSAITSVTHKRGCRVVLAQAQERSSLQLSISNIVSIDNEACNFQFTRLKIKCYVGGWIVMIWLIK